MKKYTISIIIAMAVIAACKKPQAFDYRDVRNVKIEKIGFNQTTLKLDLVYFNPNNFGVTLKQVDCDIFINKTFLGHYKLDTVMQIEKRSEFALPSQLKIDMKNVYKNTWSVLTNKEIDLNVKGNCRISKLGITVNVPFNYTGKQKLTLL